MKHVDRHLAAYTEGLLPQRAALKVRQHLAECSNCRQKLARHEELVSEIKYTLGYSAVPRDRQISDWWQNIVTVPHELTVQHRPYATMLPALLTVLIVILPFTLAIAGHSTAITAPISATMSSPAANTTISAPDSDKVALRLIIDTTTSQPGESHSATPISSSAAPVPVIPAPLAP
jgi:hypothetical protein